MGGIGCGKSSVASEFVKLGCKAIDADKIAHEILKDPLVKANLRNCFGPNIFDSSGYISHKKLADIVFCDKKKLMLLNSVIHPLVLERAEELIRQYEKLESVKCIVLDMPLLVEVGWDKRCDKLIFVDCSREIRAERTQKNGDFDKNQLKIREKFQISLDNKRNIADNTINNNSDFATLIEQVTEIFKMITNKG